MPRISEIQIIEHMEQPTLSIRLRTKVEQLPMHIGAAYGKIAAYLGELGRHPSDVPFVAYHNMDMNDLDVQIGFPVAEVLPEKDDIQSVKLPAGKFVFCMYQGPYGDMEPTYEQMGAWIQENGLEPTGVAFEYYYNGPDTPEEKLLTKIVMPVK